MPDQPPNQVDSGHGTHSPHTPKDNAGRKHHPRWPWVLLVLIPVLLGTGLLLRSKHPQPVTRGKSGATPPTLMIATATAQKGDIGVYVSALGVVTPLNTVAVRSRVDGQLVKVYYTEGQTVHQG